MVRNITQKQKFLTSAEREELAIKYEGGMTMMALANLYGCHYTTVSRILAKNNIMT